MKNGVTLRLGDVASVISGYAFKSSSFGSQGIPVIKIANIRSGYLDFSDTQKVDEEYFERLNEKYRVNPGDILISLTGSHVTQPNSVVGRVAQAPQGLNKCLLNQRAGKVILTRKDRCDTGFLYRYLTFAAAQGEIATMASGAASQANVSPGQVESLQLVLPPLDKQQRIASIFSAYDYLIENNTRRIEILEEMARRLYEEWFVHLRFPGHEEAKFKESELGEIPEGWEVATVDEAVKRFTAGKKYSQKTVAPVGSVPVLDQGKEGTIGYHDDSPGFLASPGDPVIVFANHTCYQRLIFYPFSTIQNVIPFKSSDKYMRNIFWLHHATHGLVELNDYKGHWPQFSAKQIPIAEKGVAESFGKQVEPMYHQMLTLHRKNVNLRAQRDMLLPKLVSGEIDVFDIRMPDDKEVEAV